MYGVCETSKVKAEGILNIEVTKSIKSRDMLPMKEKKSGFTQIMKRISL